MSEGQKVLLVDDDTELAGMFSDFLRGKNYLVDTAAAGGEAKKMLLAEKYSLVVSDVRMPGCTGLELLDWITAQKLSVPVILMTGFAAADQTLLAYERGCKNFLVKPFKLDDLLQAIEAALCALPKATREFDVNDFARIPIEEFLAGKKILYSIFIRMRDGHFQKIAHTGEDLDLSRIVAMRSKGVDALWLTREDFDKYSELTQKVAKLVASSANVTAEKKAELLRHAGAVAQEGLRLSGLTDSSIQAANQVFDASFAWLGSGPAALRLFEMIGSQEQSVFAHGALCGMLCGLLAKVMGWSSKKNIMALTMGGFLHDIGMNALPPSFAVANVFKLEPRDYALYQTHPMLGAKALRELPGIPEEVIRCVLEHHEDVRGSGFPRGLTRTEISPLSRPVFLVDRFCEEIMKVAPAQRKEADHILTKMVDSNRGAFEPQAVRALSIALTEPDMAKAQRLFVNAQSKHS